MKPYRTLIIDDEKIARQRLGRLLTGFGEVFQVMAEAQNGEEGLTLIRELKPDLIFLDIQMPGKTGFEMLKELDDLPIVIFCTAYEKYALQAFNTLALDYLVKPVEKERLELTVNKLKRNPELRKKEQIDALLELIQEKAKPKTLHSIPHKVGDRVILVKPEKITHFIASEKCVEFYTRDGKRYISEISLKKLEENLSDNFERVHRGIIVNVEYIQEYRKYFRGKFILVLNDSNRTKIETGRVYAKRIQELIQIK